MKKYFETEAISNSLLKRVGFFYQEKNLDNFKEQEVKDSLSMFIGEQVHLAVETKGNSLANLKILDESCFEDLTPNEIKILISENPYETYLNLYSNNNTRLAVQEGNPKSAAAIAKIKDHISDIQFKGSSYLNSKLGITDEDIVINDLKYKCDAEAVKSQIVNSYNAIANSLEYAKITDYDLFENYEDLYELEIYTEYEGYKVKAMLDRVLILHDQEKVVLIDLKTYSQGTTLIRNIFKFDYIHQLSWYRELFKKWFNKNYQIEVYIVGVNTSTYKVEVLPISRSALTVGEIGGYIKPSFYTLYNNNEEFDPYLTEADVEWLKHIGAWSNTKNNQFKRLGWREHFEIGQEYGLFDKYKV